MSVESKNSKLGGSSNGDIKSVTNGGPLGVKRGAVEPELSRIRQSLIAHRDNRDTTNHPSVERASNDRQGAISRRFQKVNTPSRNKNTAGKNKNPLIADSGTPDGDSDDSGGGGGTSDGGTTTS